jgi:hypothetical protein
MDTATLVSTRLALHSLAEHLLVGDLWRRTGKIGLRRTPGGFGQPETLDDGTRHRLRIDGTRLVVLDGDVERWEELSSPVAAATFADARLGAPTEAFTPETVLESEAPLPIDPAAASLLADWFELVEVALEEVRRRHSDLAPTLVQLWPEHFDLAFSMAEINFGGSPGDEAHDEPYLYVGPWAPLQGPAWNEPWGMSLPASAVTGWSDAVDFFETGLRAALAGAAA